MRVLQICSYYITSQLYRNLFKELDNENIKNEIYIPINNEYFINKNLDDTLKNSNYIYSKCFNSIDRIIYHRKCKKIYQDLINTMMIDKSNIDISHAHSLFINGYIAYRLKKEKNIDYIVAVRSTDIEIFFKYMLHLRRIGIEILKESKQVIFISKSYKEKLISNYIPKEYQDTINNKSLVVPNGVDDFWIKNINLRSYDNNKKEINLIYVGQMIKRKNIYRVIKCVDILRKKGYDVKLNTVGKGPEYKKVEKLVNKRYRNIIKLYGHIEKNQLIEIYRQSDIFVMPSKRETFGLVYLEAITQGIPVIYTKDEGFDGYFEDGKVGYSTYFNDTKDIANKIEKIIQHKVLDLEKVQLKLSENFKWSNIAQEYIRIYKGVIKNE